VECLGAQWVHRWHHFAVSNTAGTLIGCPRAHRR
jgi:hypothetical protein